MGEVSEARAQQQLAPKLKCDIRSRKFDKFDELIYNPASVSESYISDVRVFSNGKLPRFGDYAVQLAPYC